MGRDGFKLKTLKLIRRSRTWLEKERGVKSCDSHSKEGEWNPLRTNLIDRETLIKMFEYLDVKERPARRNVSKEDVLKQVAI